MYQSKWFKEVQKKVRIRDPNGKVLALILYSDKVAMGWGNLAVAEPVMFTLGNFASSLQQRDLAKRVLGYIDPPSFSDAMLIDHLVNNDMGPKFSKTAAQEQVRKIIS